MDCNFQTQSIQQRKEKKFLFQTIFQLFNLLLVFSSFYFLSAYAISKEEAAKYGTTSDPMIGTIVGGKF